MFETNKVLVRPLTSNDFEGLSKINGNPIIWKYFTDNLQEPENLKN